MDRYLIKRPRNSDESGTSSSPTPPIPNSNVPLNTSPTPPEFNLNKIIGDPGLRKRIKEYDASIRDRVRREYISKGPCQPLNHTFPKSQFGVLMRSFQEDWFRKYDRLKYSISKDAAYCFCCYLFKPIAATHFGDEVFIKKGFKNWTRASDKFKEHVGGINNVHNNARLQLEAFKNQRQSVSHIFSSHSRETEISYHTRLTTTLDVISILLRQGLTCRGHDESSSSMNKGNFLEFLDWYSKRNKDIFDVVSQNAPGNNQMTSPYIQKQMVDACAIETTLSILNDIGDKLFTILVDESRDISVKEQMAVVIRYVNKCGEVIERFLCVVHVIDTSSMCLKAAIDALFAKHGLSLSRLRGQGYDGASNM